MLFVKELAGRDSEREFCSGLAGGFEKVHSGLGYELD